jgi:hypothetical protein
MMGSLKIKQKKSSYLRKHGHVVIRPGEKPPKDTKQSFIVIDEDGKRLK